MQRCQRARQSGWVDGLPAGEDLERGQRPGEPAGAPGHAAAPSEQEQAGDAGQRQQPGQQELVRLR